MTPEEVDKEFEKAYERACNTSERFPPDLMLKLYAYYKQATEHTAAYIPSGNSDVKNAFKLNALLQVKGMSVLDAKRAYIDLVNENIPE
ncbi:MAG: acyl-CoA-binding protein [Salinimicrobium sediminis]|uniref:Acyl-CoA-binding protein n=1 Tax=Salinimicrobium sediminis TaxID=1343891 RepID=A0A285X6D8_9FLAO|nr:acyl-CoA-binding protein [Salinimicrobium sediminis]MDX1603657.1 acyl-CoA-binding protein [Salinimicrobium sediminis]MDX1751899.1 acyl-CoA-binding protein [Salinimicrobium sediminis]SOC80890.1 Acyl-CoA-binding protein [Salinimicrobium sediminis]